MVESRRIVALLDQVEQFGNLRPPERKVVNIHDLLDRAQKSARVSYAAHMAIVEQFDPPSLPPTFVDADQLMQVFLNLLRNAAEANPPKGGTITIRTFYDHALRLRRKDGTGNALPLQVEIIDDGPGISPEIAAQVFDPPSCRDAKTAPGWGGWPWCPRSLATTTAGSRWTRCPDAPSFASRCRSRPNKPKETDPWTAPFLSPTTIVRFAPC